MGDDTSPDDVAAIDEAPTDSLDIEHADRVEVGVSRGETDLEVGPPRDYPDRADVAIRPVSDDGDLLVLSLDAMAGDHAAGHADVTLTRTEARRLRDQLDRTLRWMADSDDEDDDRTD